MRHFSLFSQAAKSEWGRVHPSKSALPACYVVVPADIADVVPGIAIRVTHQEIMDRPLRARSPTSAPVAEPQHVLPITSPPYSERRRARQNIPRCRLREMCVPYNIVLAHIDHGQFPQLGRFITSYKTPCTAPPHQKMKPQHALPRCFAENAHPSQSQTPADNRISQIAGVGSAMCIEPPSRGNTRRLPKSSANIRSGVAPLARHVQAAMRTRM